MAETCNPDDVIIVTSSLTKDMNSREDLYKANAIRVLSKVGGWVGGSEDGGLNELLDSVFGWVGGWRRAGGLNGLQYIHPPTHPPTSPHRSLIQRCWALLSGT